MKEVGGDNDEHFYIMVEVSCNTTTTVEWKIRTYYEGNKSCRKGYISRSVIEE